ncbi:zinc finger protein 423-like [Toxorhynchites rutilus septentrionalis]|uniref:zinc finger protein 423-like n=1 Tax=Toxorhynchites rutilus septentrionalis TaxID=329112 RepID=UPI0024791A96|nr:zinc finger protein 423-like [Toxorhynchites rutilus septentrionalis]
MDLSLSSREDPFAPESIFSKQDLPVVPNDNPESYCRLCLTTPDVEPLFPMGSDPNVYMLELIGKYIGIGLSLHEDYPCALCRPCQLILDQFDLFRQNCLKVDIAIRRKRLGLDQVIKNEPLDEIDEDEADLPYIRIENRSYKCRICSQIFRSLSLFMVHCKEEHPGESRMFKCKICDKSFMTKTARLAHIRSHKSSNSQEADLTSDRIQVCEKCMVTFDSYKLLKIHIKDHHSNDPKQDTLVCSTCSKQFSRITILRNHILRVHLGKLPHACKHCGISFGYSQQLLIHLKHEHGIVMSRQEQLNQSGQSFTEEEFDNEEENQIMPPVPEVVEEQPPQAVTPEPAPSRRNKYTCIDCSMQCSSHDELRNHRKIHQDPTWWKCMHCRNFVKHQKMHLMKKHPTIADSDDVDSSFELRYRCWLCRVYFKSIQQMEVHANVRHQIPLPRNHQPPEADQSMSDEGGDVGEHSMVPLKQPTPMTVQPPLAIGPEHLPLLLSQLENGAWDYVKDIRRFMDPANLSAYSVKIKEDPDQSDTSANAMDLSGMSEQAASSRDVSFNAQSRDDIEQDDLNENDSDDDYFVRLENRTYQCKFCTETFRHLLLIRKHVKLQHPTEWKSFRCGECKRRFPSAAIRDRHAHFHSLDHPFKCTKCDQVYATKKRLEQHVSFFHESTSPTFTLERIRCGPCRLLFTEKKYYDLHSRVYHDRKPTRLKNLTTKIQVCERCVITFNSRELLSEHMKQFHQSDPPMVKCECPKCAKDLKTLTLLRIHILVVHLGHLPFVCQYCEAAFSSRHWLLKHVEKDHSEQVTYKCPACDESFNSEQKLTLHQDQLHSQPQFEFDPNTGLALFPCTKCDKKLESKDLHEKHMLKAHPTFMLLYKCPLCTKPIRYRRQHMRIHHDVDYDPKEHIYQTRYKCHCCSKLFKQKRLLSAHQNALSFQCDRCQMRFKTKKSLQAHGAVHKITNALKCEDCGLEVAYRARLEEHRRRFHSSTSTETLKLISCPYCPKLFMSMSNRERHISVHHPQDGFQIECHHCPLKVTDTTVLRKHYRTDHPEERCTFKCPVCAKVYLHASSYKTHFKQHKTGVKERREREKLQNSMLSGEGGSEAEKSQQPLNAKDFIKQELNDEEAEVHEPEIEVKLEPGLAVEETTPIESSVAANEQTDDIKTENGIPQAEDGNGYEQEVAAVSSTNAREMSKFTTEDAEGRKNSVEADTSEELNDAETDSATESEMYKALTEEANLRTSSVVDEAKPESVNKSQEENDAKENSVGEGEISQQKHTEVSLPETGPVKAVDAECTGEPKNVNEQNNEEKNPGSDGESSQKDNLKTDPSEIEQKVNTDEVINGAGEPPLSIPTEQMKTKKEASATSAPHAEIGEGANKQNDIQSCGSGISKDEAVEGVKSNSSILDTVVQKTECDSENTEIKNQVGTKSSDTPVETLKNAIDKVVPATECKGESKKQTIEQITTPELNNDDAGEKDQTKDGEEEMIAENVAVEPKPEHAGAPAKPAETKATEPAADDGGMPPNKKIKQDQSVDDNVTDS